jgi:phage terminase small subunit
MSEMGPAMAALSTDQQRRFVEHYVATGGSNQRASAQAAGYSVGNAAAARVTATRLLQDPKVQAAVSEVAQGYYAGDLPKYTAALRKIALNPNHKDQTKVLIWLHQTMGISPITRGEHKITQQVTVTFDRQKAIAELQQLERDRGISLFPRLNSSTDPTT